MHRLLRFLQVVAVGTVLLAALCALVGFLVAHFSGAASAAHGIAWAMWIGGALVGLVAGQSGSPSRMAVEGRWGFFGQYWGGNPPLPRSPFSIVVAAFLVIAIGVGVFAIG